MSERVLGDRFVLQARLGQGGSATVWLAEDRLTGEQIALKLLHEHLTDDPAARDRLAREVRAANRIRHPHVWLARELHELDGRLALSMPLHEGTTLADRVARRGELPAEELQQLAEMLAGALAAAHAQGVVHRDLTPTNVFIDGEHAALADFGLAHLDDQAIRSGTRAMGTWGYAAPEIFQGRRADPRSDLYSLGAVLYLAATGRGPYEAPSAGAVLRRQLAGEHRPLAELRPELPAELRHTIEQLLQVDPADRPLGARAVLDALQGRGEAAPPRPPTSLAPVGPYTLIIAERRRELRRRDLRKRSGPIQPDEAADPERSLLESVVRHTGLPVPEQPPAEMRRGEFKLLEGVPRDLAEAVFADAMRAGFEPRLVDDPFVKRSARRGQREIVVGSLLLAGAVLAFTAAPVLSWMSLFGAVGFVLLAIYTFYLAVDRNTLRSALPRIHDQPQLPAPRPAQQPSDPFQQVHRSTVAAVDRLDAAIVDADLPAAALRDLQEQARRLRAATERLAGAAHHQRPDRQAREAQEQTAARIRRRLEQLEVQARLGQAVDAQEQERLEAALQAQRHQAETDDLLQRQRTLLSARLLEIGAAATAAVHSLLGSTDLARSTADLLARLDDEARLAREAIDEVQSPPRRPGQPTT